MIIKSGGPSPTSRYPTLPSVVWITHTGDFTMDTDEAGNVVDELDVEVTDAAVVDVVDGLPVGEELVEPEEHPAKARAIATRPGPKPRALC